MIDRKHKSLGRGLSALLGDMGDTGTLSNKPETQNSLPIEILHPGKYQPRRILDKVHIEELANSIEEKGIIQPIIVRKSPEKADYYEIIAGERRWRAAQIARLHNVPVIIKEFTNQQALELALIENIQRQDLSPLEEAEGYKRLMDEFSYTQEQLASGISKSRSHVANMIRLIKLPAEVKSLVDKNLLTIGHARALLNFKDPIFVARLVVKKGLSVRETENLVRKLGDPKSRIKVLEIDRNLLDLEGKLENILGIPVRLKTSGEKGTLELKYTNLDQLDDLLKKLGVH